MADKEVKNEPNEPKATKVVPEKTVPAQHVTNEKNADATPNAATDAATKKKRIFVIALIGGIIVLYIAAILVGLQIYKHVEDRRAQTYGGTSTMRQVNSGRFNGEQTYTVRHSTSDGLTTTTTNETYTQTQGVVTAVSGDSITVAGGGKTQVIKTNGDTIYADDTKPAVNDTVVIVGTKDGETITATEIRVYTYDD